MKLLEEFHPLPYAPLDAEAERENEEIMRRGSIAIKALHEQVLEKRGWKRKCYPRATFRQELFKAMEGSNLGHRNGKGRPPTQKPLFIHGVRVSKQSFLDIRATQAIQQQMIFAYSRLVEKLAFRFWKNNQGTIAQATIGLQDFYNEGVLGIINAVYHYIHPTVRFMTYVYHCVRRKMVTAANGANPLSPWSYDAYSLHNLYLQAQQELTQPTTFDEVAEYLELSDQERELVQDTLRSVCHASAMKTAAGKGEHYQTPFDILGVELASVEPARLEPDERAAVEAAKARMTPFERDVLAGYLKGMRGWQVAVADAHTNPKTGKPYSRRAPAVVLPRLFQMVLEEYSASEAQEYAERKLA